jgi:ubiquinone/menaquinone biosynthesis C-methylase UbiE
MFFQGANMAHLSDRVQSHYTHGGLLDRVIEFLKKAGVDPENMTHEDLFRCDQMHGRGIAATREHIEHAGIEPGTHVLDLGCGIGGSSRVIATACDCRVTGIDLTQEFIDVAGELTSRCGLADRIAFRQGDALHMPFENSSFDHVWSHNVTMNIEDKAGLAVEIARVLKSGGRYSSSEFVRGAAGEPFYPLPWASDAGSSFLMTEQEMVDGFEAAGLRVVEVINLNETNLAFFKAMRERAERGEPPLAVNPQAFKSAEEFQKRIGNSGRSAAEGRLAELLVIAERT